MASPVLNFKSFGEGDPVIILHGLFGMLDNWKSFGQKLAETNLVYLVDQRDHGKSPHTKDFNYPVLSEDLRQFMESQWIYKAHIIGHSMGGKTAMQFAADNDDMVDKLIIIDIAPKEYGRKHDNILDALHALKLDTLTSRNAIKDSLSRDIEDESVVNFLLKNIKRDKENGFGFKFNLSLLTEKYDAINRAPEFSSPIDVPALFVRGSKSDYIKESDDNTILNHFPNAQFKTLKNAGHWVHADQPGELLKIVTTFLNN